jgi:glycosyltransferase involved in cell wall biosynthesis
MAGTHRSMNSQNPTTPATKKRKLLCLCDSPTLQTGFARVAQNLLSRWHASGFFEQIWVWGIGYNGFPHQVAGFENRICPASSVRYPHWYDPKNLGVFAEMICDQEVGLTPGGFTHVWMMQDTFALTDMAGSLRQSFMRAGAASFLYFPVDAPLSPKWTSIIAAVETPVAYCEYGRSEATRALETPMFDEEEGQRHLAQINIEIKAAPRGKKERLLAERQELISDSVNVAKVDQMRADAVPRLLAIPHGVDTSVYFKLPDEEKHAIRKRLFHGRVTPEDFLIINVSQHQKRKGLAQTLIVFKTIKELRPETPVKLYMHMASANRDEGTDLRDVAQQLGLKDGVDIFYGDGSFSHGYATTREDTLNRVYNCADLMLSTSYGEGWGLPVTEAMAAGVPVAAPRHTSLAELLADDRGVLFDTLGSDMIIGDHSRIRPRSDCNDAARRIIAAATTDPTSPTSLASIAARGQFWARGDFMNWDRIADQWLSLFEGKAI